MIDSQVGLPISSLLGLGHVTLLTPPALAGAAARVLASLALPESSNMETVQLSLKADRIAALVQQLAEETEVRKSL